MDAEIREEAEKQWNEAKSFLCKKDYKLAIEKINSAIKLYPFLSSYYEGRSFCYEKLRFYDFAEKDAIEAIKLHPNNNKGYLQTAKCCILTGKSKEALNWLSNIKDIKSLGHKFETIEKWIMIYQKFKDLFDSHNFNEAYDKIEELIKMKCCAYFELQKSLCLANMKRGDEALEIIENFAFQDISRVEVCAAFYTISLIMYFKGELKTAMNYLQELPILLEDQDMIASVVDLLNKSNEFEMLMSKAETLTNEEKYLTALSTYNQALKIDPQNGAVNSILHFNRGKVYMKIENYTDAIKDFSISIESDCINVQALLLRTECFSKLKMIEDYGKGIMNLLERETTLERNNSLKRTAKYDNDEHQPGTNSKKQKTKDTETQCDLIGSYELSFISKPNTEWKLSRTIEGKTTVFPFFRSEGAETDVDVSSLTDETNDFIYQKITLFKQNN